MTPLSHIHENVPAHEILVYLIHQQAAKASQRPEYFKDLTEIEWDEGMKQK